VAAVDNNIVAVVAEVDNWDIADMDNMAAEVGNMEAAFSYFVLHNKK
jgi:hypothetical protein